MSEDLFGEEDTYFDDQFSEDEAVEEQSDYEDEFQSRVDDLGADEVAGNEMAEGDDDDDDEDEPDPNLDYSQSQDDFQPNAANFEPELTVLKPEFAISLDSTPLQILQKFLSVDIINEVVNETNRYSDQTKRKNRKAFRDWIPVSTQEIWRFFSLTLMMGLIKKPALKDYWSSDPLFSTPFFGQTMSRNRFQSILRALHFVNNETVPTTNKDRFIKLGNFMKGILKNFQKAIFPQEYLCIDETLLAYKGRLSFRQYNPKKRARFGIKLFVICDCALKFVLDIIPYQGKSTTLTDRTWVSTMGFGGAAVLTLLQKYLYKAHRVILDNWFVSPNLAKRLKELGTYILGTVQKKRKGMPKFSGKLRKGEVEVYYNENMMVERWMDRREVMMLNTFMHHSMKDSISTNPKNTREKPETVLLYNATMGAVDNIDKTIKPYQSVRKSFKWYKKIAFNLLDMSIYNSYVLYSHLRKPLNIPIPPFKEFIRIIIRNILDQNPVPKNAISQKSISNSSSSTRISGPHYPKKYNRSDGKSSFSDCVYCKNFKRKNERTRKGTAYGCSTCQVRLCIDGENSCFDLYHSLKGQGSQSHRAVTRPPLMTQTEPSQNVSQSEVFTPTYSPLSALLSNNDPLSPLYISASFEDLLDA